MPNIERPILNEEYIKKIFGEKMGRLAEAERIQTVSESEAVDREQAKTGRPLILAVK